MGLGDLATQDQPNAGTAGLGSEKGDEEVCYARKTWPLIPYRYLYEGVIEFPA